MISSDFERSVQPAFRPTRLVSVVDLVRVFCLVIVAAFLAVPFVLLVFLDGVTVAVFLDGVALTAFLALDAGLVVFFGVLLRDTDLVTAPNLTVLFCLP